LNSSHKLPKIALTVALATIIALVCALHAIEAQDQSETQSQRQTEVTAPLSFDAASVKEWGPGEAPAGDYMAGVEVFPGRVASDCANLASLLSFAYHLTLSTPKVGMPDWGRAGCGAGFTNIFRIEATMPAGTTNEQARQMMQTLLANRFKLAFHWEKKEMPIYVLVVASGGFKLKPSDPNDKAPLPAEVLRCPPDDPHCRKAAGSGSISDLAGLLGGLVGRPVVDETGLAGNYRFFLKWASDDTPNSTLPSLATLLKEQFGLELKSGKGPLDVFVIDHVEKPTPN
jgi:uncharacterized protein (TIGR03435 family)